MIRRPGRQGPAVRPLRPAVLRPGARPGGGVRRTRPVRRASARVTPVRAGALLAILLGVAAIYGLVSSDAFALRRTTIVGNTWTSDERILDLLAVPDGLNLFAVRTGELETAVASIPAITGALVTVALPDELRVTVTEPEALVAWRVGQRRFLVDTLGVLFAELPAEPAGPVPALPQVDDARNTSMVLEVGSVLDPVTLDAALRLAALSPADVGSGARALVLRVDDQAGFSMRTRPASWTAVFGFFTPTLRTTELIPGQVRLLRSLLAGRETSVARVILADDHSGTYIPVESPEATRTPRPKRTARPDATALPASTPAP